MTRPHQPRHSGNGLRIAVLAHLHHPIASPFAGGLETHTAQVVAALANRGHDVVLFAKGGSSVTCRHIAVLDGCFSVAGHPDSAGRDLQHDVLDRAMATSVRYAQDGYDVVLNNSLSPVPHVGLRGCPTLNVFHTPPLPRIVEVFSGAGWAPDPQHAYVSVSESNARAWREHLPDIGVIHNGIPLEQWGAGGRRRIGQAVWTGRITPEKGAHVAIAAARRAGMDLVLAGPIHDREYFSMMIEPELDDSIRHVGHLDHRRLRGLIAGAEVFVASPLWEEPFGLNVVEALACGTPVAALPGGAMAEILDPGAGVVARDSGAEALAEAVAAARALPNEAVLRASLRFSIETMVDRYEEAMLGLVAETAAAATAHESTGEQAGETAAGP